jgi:hypothetical protein
MRTYVVQTVDNNGNHKLYIHQAENVLQALLNSGFDIPGPNSVATSSERIEVLYSEDN